MVKIGIGRTVRKLSKEAENSEVRTHISRVVDCTVPGAAAEWGGVPGLAAGAGEEGGAQYQQADGAQ